ncbi:hypothetical protein DNTS_016043, partial [Danionella cerebrum]
GSCPPLSIQLLGPGTSSTSLSLYHPAATKTSICSQPPTSHHSKMELLGVRFSKFHEEKYQMLELNQRLESYLGRVKLLEEENKLLREEISTLKRTGEPPGQRKAQEEALSQARRLTEEAWRKKDHVELEIENLMEDVEKVSIQRQKIKTAQDAARRKLTESKKDLEEEKRAQIWLREKVGQLEKDLLLHMQEHQENVEALQATLKQTKQVLMMPHHATPTSIPDLGQEYSSRAAQAWQEATNNYKKQTERLEESLNKTKVNMAKIHQEKRENQHQVQHLAKELESTKAKRQVLEKQVMMQREEQKCELQHLQAQVDSLELERDNLGQQINGLMFDRQNLLQVKMSLGLEVATYRALLDSEGLANDQPATHKNTSASLLALSKPSGIQSPSRSTGESCHFSRTVSPSHRSIRSSHTLLSSATPSSTASKGTLQKPQTEITEKMDDHRNRSEQFEQFEHRKKDLTEESVDLLPEEKDLTLEMKSAEDSDDIMVEDETKQFWNTQMVESVWMSAPANFHVSEDAGDSEDGKDEDIEVSVEMARISHAPKVACEENKTGAKDEKGDDQLMSSQHPITQGSPINEQGTLDLIAHLGCEAETFGDQMKVDEVDTASDVGEDQVEQLNGEAAIEWDRQEETDAENETMLGVDETFVTDKKYETLQEQMEKEEETEREISLQDDGQESVNITDNVEKTFAEHYLDQTENRPEDEQKNLCDEDDSPNISASLRSDAGECDSQENTLADTRPLIRYKSDEEPSQYIGEASDSEDDRIDRGHWNEGTSKRFNTMEDLTEEPDMDVTGELMMKDDSKEESLEKVQEFVMIPKDLGPEMMGEEREFKANLEDASAAKRKDYALNISGQNECLPLIETSLITEHKYESQVQTSLLFSSTISETPQQESFESLLMLPDDAPTEEGLVDVSMHTNIDHLDNPSLEDELNGHPDVTSDMPNLEQEECISSADESPNASQCFQNTSLLPTAVLNEEPLTFANGVSVADHESYNNDVPEEVRSEKIDHQENCNIWGQEANASMDPQPGLFVSNDNFGGLKESVLDQTMLKFDQHQERSDLVTVTDFESISGEFQSQQSKSEIHSFIATSMNMDFWEDAQREMAATCDPEKTEHINLVFGDGKEEGKQIENGNAKEEMDILKDMKKKVEQPRQGQKVQSEESADEGDSWSSGDE